MHSKCLLPQKKEGIDCWSVPVHTIKPLIYAWSMTGPCFNQYLIFSRAVLGLFFRRDFTARFSLKYVSIGLFLVLYGKSVRMLREPEDFAKTHSAKKKEKAQPKNCLPCSNSYRRSCSHFNYYLIPRDEHVATLAVSLLPDARLPPAMLCPARTEPTYTHKNLE